MNMARTKSTSCRNLVQDVCSSSEQICGKNDILSRYKLQRAKLETISTEKTAQLNMEFLKQDLEKTASETQTLRRAINDLERSNAVTDCKSSNVKELSDICKVKSSMNLDLTNLLQQQCDLKRQLEQTRKALRNAKIDNLLISEELKRIDEPCWEELSSHQDAEAQNRFLREQQARNNAILARETAITSVANSITTHVLHKLKRAPSRSATNAREILGKYMQKSFQKERENKVIATTEYQLRQRRQIRNLQQLKRDLGESRKMLAINSEMKRTHDGEMALENEKVKDLLSLKGANPYLAEYLLEVEEKHRELQRKMLAEEQTRLMDMQREYSVIEVSKYKEEKERQKWDEYWAKRAKDKVEQKKKEEHEKYFEVDTDTEEEPTKRGSEGKARSDASELDRSMRKSMKGDGQRKGRKSRGKRRLHSGLSEKSAASKKTGGRVSKSGSAREDQNDVQSEEPSVASNPGTKRKDRLRGNSALSTRKAIHLDVDEKESLMNIADETTKAILMDGGLNFFYFGDVSIGERKYVMVNVANIGTEVVSLKMSPLNPYGPFTFCNSLKEIPPDSYYSLKYKYQPTESGESEEMIKIEEVGKRDNFIIIKLKGQGISD